MKKKLFLSIALLAVGATGLASCANDPSTVTSSSGSSSVSVSTSTNNYPAATVQLTASSSEIEVNETTTIRSTILEEVSDTSVNFTIDNTDVLAFDGTNEGVRRVTVKGLKPGTATVTATSVVNPESTASVTITVVEAVPTLADLFENLRENKNYTITATATGISGVEGDVTTYIYTTENAIASAYKIGDGELSANYALNTDDEDEDNDIARYGIGIGKDGYGLYLDKNKKTGEFVSPATRVTGGSGFVTKDTLYGEDSVSAFSTPLFYNYGAIDTSWLSSFTKDTSNTYEISVENSGSNLSETELNLMCANYFFFNLLNPTGLVVAIRNMTNPTNGDIASIPTTTIQAFADNTVVIDMDCGSYGKVHAVMENIGTTSLDTFDSSINTFLASDKAVSEYEMSTQKKVIWDAVQANNYTSYSGKSYYFPSLDPNGQHMFGFYNYYGEDFFGLQFIDDESLADLEKAFPNGKDNYQYASILFVYDNYVIMGTYDLINKEILPLIDENGDLIVDENNQANASFLSLTDNNLGLKTLQDVVNYIVEDSGDAYLSSWKAFSSEALFAAFSDTLTEDFTGIKWFGTKSSVIGKDAATRIFSKYSNGDEILNAGSSYVAGLEPTFQGSTLTSLTVYGGVNAGGSKYYLEGNEYDNFGQADELCPAYSLIDQWCTDNQVDSIIAALEGSN